MAEKWFNIMDLSNPVEFDTYCTKIVEQIFMKRDVMYQLAFDFYDCNNDDKVSEMDLFKVIQSYGSDSKSVLFNHYLQQDILVMLKLIAHQRNATKASSSQSELSLFKQGSTVSQPIDSDGRFKHFRHLISTDKNFLT